jgi:hypothetical protein
MAARSSSIKTSVRCKRPCKTVVHVRHRGLYEVLVVVKDGSHVSAHSAPVLLR